MLPHPDLMLSAFAPDLNGARRVAARAMFPRVRRKVVEMFGIDEQSVASAFESVRIAGERFRTELQPSGYLVGGKFTVADLTLAALVAPIVAPQQFPYPQPQREHPALEPVRAVLAESGLLDWTREVYALRRSPSAVIAG
jgi:glutathione S-transferase